MSSAFGGGWTAAAAAQGRGAILEALIGSASPASSSDAAHGVRSGFGAAPQRRHASSSEDAAVSPAGAGPRSSRGANNAAAGDDAGAAAAAGASPPGRLSAAEMAVGILVDCFGH